MRLTVCEGLRKSMAREQSRGGCSSACSLSIRHLAPLPCSPPPSGLPFRHSSSHNSELSGTLITMAELRCALHLHFGAQSNPCQQCPYGTRQGRRVSMQAGWKSAAYVLYFRSQCNDSGAVHDCSRRHCRSPADARGRRN